jgi:hypothetical protein
LKNWILFGKKMIKFYIKSINKESNKSQLKSNKSLGNLNFYYSNEKVSDEWNQ